MRNEICIPEFQTRTQNSTSYTRRQESSLDQRHSYLSDDQRKLAQLVRNCFTVKLTSSRNVCFHSVQITSLRACRLEQRSLSRGRWITRTRWCCFRSDFLCRSTIDRFRAVFFACLLQTVNRLCCGTLLEVLDWDRVDLADHVCNDLLGCIWHSTAVNKLMIVVTVHWLD